MCAVEQVSQARAQLHMPDFGDHDHRDLTPSGYPSTIDQALTAAQPLLL